MTCDIRNFYIMAALLATHVQNELDETGATVSASHHEFMMLVHATTHL